MKDKKPHRIAFIVDTRLSRERAHIVMRALNVLRHIAEIKLLSGNLSESEVLAELGDTHFDLVLAPWYRYIAWSKVEALFGKNRTSGPTFAGYFGDSVLPYELGDLSDDQRAILLDFSRLNTAESVLIIQSLLKDSNRWGLRPLLLPSTPIHTDTWTSQGAAVGSSQGIGSRLDAITRLPDCQLAAWASRHSSVRLAFTAMWSFFHDEGPGKIAQSKASFQMGVDAQSCALRLSFRMSSWKPLDALNHFRPQPNASSSPAQLLLRHSDLLRVHLDPDTGELEIVALFVPSAPAEKAPNEIHTLWVEPLSSSVRVEDSPQLLKPLLPETDSTSGESSRKVIELKKALEEREQMISELRSGGVGTAAPFSPPDAESLLEGFQERFLQARLQIRQFQTEIDRLARQKGKPEQVFRLKQEMAILAERQKKWINALSDTLERHRLEKESEASAILQKKGK